MTVDSSLISLALKKPEIFVELQRAGITHEYFTDDYAKAFRWVAKMKKEHGSVPSVGTVESRFPRIEIKKVRERDLPVLVSELRQRRKYMDFLGAIEEASRVDGPEGIDIALSELQVHLNQLSVRNGKNSLIDLFGEEARKRMLKDQALRRRGTVMGLPTGLKRFDMVTSGLQRGRMTVAIGRPGTGKSWLDLLFVASAVMSGGKIGLYPLEMTLEETAMRLYTIFSCRMFGAEKSIKNLDLANGRVSKAKIVRLMNKLEDKFPGQLYVADIGTMSDPYTIERIEAEQEIYQFDMFWVDYLTLMKAPGVGRDGGEDHTTVKALSNGIKQIAVRHNTVGGVSAQVSRLAISGRAFLPRLEHIAYGDSIGQDADHVVSLNRKGPHLYYGMVKNRHGPEIPKTRVKFMVNDGKIEEDEQQDDDDDDD